MTAADKLRELLASRPAMPNTEELVRWWRTSAELVRQVLDERKVLTTGRLDGLVISPVLDGGEIRSLHFTVETLPGLRLVLEADAARELRDALGMILGDQSLLADLDDARAKLRREQDARAKLRLELDRLKPAAEVFEHGFWRSCSGCHETDQGHPTGPYSEALRCNLGSGCHECGGIGATWEQLDEEVIAGADLLVGDKVAPVTVVGRTADGIVTLKVDDPATIALLKKGAEPVSLGYLMGEPATPADDDSRCAVCGWPLAESVEDGCVRGNCSMRPRPERLYAPERAARESGRDPEMNLCNRHADCAAADARNDPMDHHAYGGPVLVGQPRPSCQDNSPPWFTGRWRDWHRGHGCDKDDGKPRTPEGQAEIERGGR